MKRDLDRLMEERGLDALVVEGKSSCNPALYYFLNGVVLGLGGTVIQKRGHEPVLLCAPIDREEASASGLSVRTTQDYDYAAILREADDELSASIELFRRVFGSLGIVGRVGFYGMKDQGRAWLLLNALNTQLDNIQVHGDFGSTPIDAARATKDITEVQRIREVGRRTCEVVASTVEFLRAHRVNRGVLIQADGTPLTIGRVHEAIDGFVAGQRLETPEGYMFVIGRDAGFPHGKGHRDDVIALGKTILFDIFPHEAGGGYSFDITRTFCLGYAPPEVVSAYRDVSECKEMVIQAYQVGELARSYQQKACRFLESRGHITLGSDPNTKAGYVHGIGHGLGLAVHESPSFRDVPSNTDRLAPGHVFTCEPGLYYPDRGFGVRIEDVIWIDAEGAAHNLTDFPQELVIEL